MRPPPRGPSNSFKLLRPASSARRINATRPVTCSPTPPSCKFFRCNTYGFPRKCCKQKTYGRAKSFRCNTYRKQGVGTPPCVPSRPSLTLPAPSRLQRFDQRPRPCRKEPVPSVSQNTSQESPVTAHIPLSTTEQPTPSSVLYIVSVLSSPLCIRGIARSFCVGGRHEQSIEDCLHRRRRVDRSRSRRAVFDSRQSVPPHH